MTTIGLCMIVKNEAAVIRRCLDSVRPIIDHWVIVDTGSTDNTQNIIRSHLCGLPGELYERTWRDFAHNRSEALELARGKSDYILIIDADDTLEIAPDTTLPALTADCYTVEIGDTATVYRRPQLVRGALPWRYEGVLHEYLTCECAGPSDHLSAIGMRRNHDGARRKDPETYRRDAAVLEAALLTETSAFLISRYRFYLAQSYRDSGDREKALDNYLARAKLGFWQEEVFVALYQAAQMKEHLAYPDQEVIDAYLRAADSLPARAEALHGATRFCRYKGRNEEGYQIAKRGLKIPMLSDGLFVEPWIYETGLLDEFAVNAYWCGHNQECLEASLKILATGKLSGSEMQRVVANAQAAREKLPRDSNLGSFGAEGLIEQHALGTPRPLRTQLDKSPKVLVAILAKQKEPSLPLYLECIEALEYPKSSIVLYVRTNNNTDTTERILREWLARVGHLYAAVEFDPEDVTTRIEQFSVHEWNATRFRVLGRIRNISLRRTLDHDCDFYFVADVDNFVRPCTLRELVALNAPIVAPLLRSIDPRTFYSNYHAEIDANGYYRECDQYQWVLNRWIRGVLEVPVVHCTYLVRADVLNDLTYEDGTDRYEYVVFSDSARKSAIPQYLDNRQVYGYITFEAGDCQHTAGEIERARTLLDFHSDARTGVEDQTEELNGDPDLHKATSSRDNGQPVGKAAAHSTEYSSLAERVILLVHPTMVDFLSSVIVMLADGLREISIEPEIVYKLQVGFNGRTIVLGANFFTAAELRGLRRDVIVFNVENTSSVFITEDYRKVLNRCCVWDYDPTNAAALAEILGRPVYYLKTFYVERLKRIAAAASQDIDVLFYGSFYPRRSKVLDGLRERGLRVEAVFRVFGAELEQLITRSKVVINIHSFDNGRLEMIRIFDLLANGRAVITELNPGELVDADLIGAFVAVPYNDLVDATLALIQDEDRRIAVAKEGFRVFSLRRARDILREALRWRGTPMSAIEVAGRIEQAPLQRDVDLPVRAGVEDQTVNSTMSPVSSTGELQPGASISHTTRLKTLIFCTSYAKIIEAWDGRYRRWLHAIRSSQLHYDNILIVDDGSPVLPDWADITINTDDITKIPPPLLLLHHFQEHLGRRDVFDFPGWYRSFTFAAEYANAHGFEKVIHIESDAFLIGPRVVRYFNEAASGWTTLWCPLYGGFPESAIQVIAGNSIPKFLELYRTHPHERLIGQEFELQLPFEVIEKKFKGDRYGEYLPFVPGNADYAAQVPDNEPDEYYWWIKYETNHANSARALLTDDGLDAMQLDDHHVVGEIDQARTLPGADHHTTYPGRPVANTLPVFSQAAEVAEEPNGLAEQLSYYFKHDHDAGSHSGIPYIPFLRLIFLHLEPLSYLEIGTESGTSLKQFQCDALCIDPAFQISHDVLLGREKTFFFQMTSDSFFAKNDPRIFFGGGVDVGFLDGLHHFEALLRDFINFERSSHKDSIVLLHDCLPTDLVMASRTFHWGAWTGDVWKILPALKKHRPDLRVLLLDCPPTGLVACYGLDASSTTLQDKYEEIIEDSLGLVLGNTGLQELRSMFPLVDTRALMEVYGDTRLIFDRRSSPSGSGRQSGETLIRSKARLTG